MKTIFLDFKFFALLIILSLLLFVFDNLGFLNLPRLLLQTLTVPIQYGLYTSSRNIGDQFSFIKDDGYRFEMKGIVIISKRGNNEIKRTLDIEKRFDEEGKVV